MTLFNYFSAQLYIHIVTYTSLAFLASNSNRPTFLQTYPTSPLNKPITSTNTASQKPQISPKPAHLLSSDTIEMTLPPDLNSPGLQTWPLKNRIISTDNVTGKTQPPQTGNSVPTPYVNNGGSQLSPPGRFSGSYQQCKENGGEISKSGSFNSLPVKVLKTTIDEVN